jgi:hypothetical protein
MIDHLFCRLKQAGFTVLFSQILRVQRFLLSLFFLLIKAILEIEDSYLKKAPPKNNHMGSRLVNWAAILS